jgi:NADPH-ferrihemoprotein reductase
MAEAFANDLEFDAKEKNIETELIDASEFTMESFANFQSSADKYSVTALIMAVYGEGEPTDNAKKFCHELFSSKKTLCQDHRFSVFGLGNSQCFKDRFNVVSTKVDDKLKSLGASRVMPLTKGDAAGDIFGMFNEWKAKMLDHIEANKQTGSVAVADTEFKQAASSSVTPDTHHRFTHNPAISTPVLSPRQLAMAPADRSIVLGHVKSVTQLFTVADEINSAVELKVNLDNCQVLKGSSDVNVGSLTAGLMSGDHIGVFAPNSNQVINRFAVAAELTNDELDSPLPANDSTSCSIASAAATTTLRQQLTWQLQLTGVVPVTTIKLLQRWASNNNMTVSAAYLQFLIDSYEVNVKGASMNITTLLNTIPKSPRFPKLPIAMLLKSFSPLSPRLYSLTIDPSTCAQTHSVSLLCRLLRYRDSNKRIRDGVCSSYICEHLQPNQDVAVFFRQSAFHLPTTATTPVIMIGGGSGLAPFISFLEARESQLRQMRSNGSSESLGPAILYYGCRRPDEYMMRDRLLKYYESGALSELIISFSHQNPDIDSSVRRATHGEYICPGTRNITDIVLDDIPKLASSVMQQNAHIYVCGGAGMFGKAVRNAVNELMLHCGSEQFPKGHDDKGEHNGIRYLVQNKRYFEDLAD